MKKNSLIKAIIITFLIYVVASWIIPGGTFTSGKLVNGGTEPVGLGNLFIYPISTAITSIFVLTGLIILLIGGLYSVMNKTGVYQKVVEGTVKKFKGKERTFLIISVLVFALLASLTTLTFPLLVMVPFFVAVILSLGYNKMTAMLSTVGAILVGNMGTIFGYNTGGYSYVNYFFGLKTTENIAYKIALFVLLTIVLLVFVIKTSKIEKVTKKTRKTKKDTKETEEEKKAEVVIPLYRQEKANKKSATPLVVIMIIMVVVALVSMFNWAGALGIEKTWFDEIYTKIMETELNGYPLFSNLIGSINPFGYWTNYEFAMLLMITIIVIGCVYNLKLSETYEAVVEGMKEMLPVAAVAILANILLLIVNSVANPFMNTIFNFFFEMTKGLNIATMSIISAIGSIAYSDFPYLMNALAEQVTILYAKTYPTAQFIMQSMYGFVMMLVPTSVGLVVGLEYLGISYKEWLKENWKLLLSLLVAALLVIIVMVLV